MSRIVEVAFTPTWFMVDRRSVSGRRTKFAVRNILGRSKVVNDKVATDAGLSSWSRVMCIVHFKIDDELYRILDKCLNYNTDFIHLMYKDKMKEARKLLRRVEHRNEKHKERRERREQLKERAETINPFVHVIGDWRGKIFFKRMKIDSVDSTVINLLDRIDGYTEEYNGNKSLRCRYDFIKTLNRILAKKPVSDEFADAMKDNLRAIQTGEFDKTDLKAMIAVT